MLMIFFYSRNQRTDNSAPKRAQVAKAPRHDLSAPKVEAGVSLSEHLLQLQRCVAAIPQPTLHIHRWQRRRTMT